MTAPPPATKKNKTDQAQERTGAHQARPNHQRQNPPPKRNRLQAGRGRTRSRLAEGGSPTGQQAGHRRPDTRRPGTEKKQLERSGGTAFTGRQNWSPQNQRAMATAALPFVLHWAVDWGPLAAAGGASREVIERFGFIMQALDAGMDAEHLCRQARAVCRALAHPAIITGHRACDFLEGVVDNLSQGEEHRRAVELGI